MRGFRRDEERGKNGQKNFSENLVSPVPVQDPILIKKNAVSQQTHSYI